MARKSNLDNMMMKYWIGFGTEIEMVSGRNFEDIREILCSARTLFASFASFDGNVLSYSPLDGLSHRLSQKSSPESLLLNERSKLSWLLLFTLHIKHMCSQLNVTIQCFPPEVRTFQTLRARVISREVPSIQKCNQLRSGLGLNT